MPPLSGVSSQSGDALFDKVLEALVKAGARIAKRSGHKARLFCPAHSDRRPSLGLTRESDRVLMYCFAGCKTPDILRVANLIYADLFEQPGIRTDRRVVAAYDYVDLSGVIVARKLRFEPKSFRWQHPHPRLLREWKPGFGATAPSLYRLPDIQGRDSVFLCEGEKAVDRCWEFGLAACCPPSGAGRWLPEWTDALRSAGCESLIVLPDNDQPGLRFAECAAAANHAAGVKVKVLRLPGLRHGADAFDWFEEHSHLELQALAVSAEMWAPGAAERAQIERRRALTRLRVQRHRAKPRGIALASWRSDGKRCNAVTL